MEEEILWTKMEEEKMEKYSGPHAWQISIENIVSLREILVLRLLRVFKIYDLDYSSLFGRSLLWLKCNV